MALSKNGPQNGSHDVKLVGIWGRGLKKNQMGNKLENEIEGVFRRQCIGMMMQGPKQLRIWFESIT